MSGTASQGLSPAHAQLILEAIKAGLRVVLTSPTVIEPAQPVTAALVPASPEIDASDLANGAINLALTAKDVIFSNASVLDVPTQGDMDGNLVAGSAGVLGGQPLPLPLGTVGPAPVPSAANVPGLLGQVFGSLAAPKLKVQAAFRWIVRRDGVTQKEGENFIAPQGLGSPSVSLVLPPLIRELRIDTLEKPPADLVCLSVEVTLWLGTQTIGPFEVGPIPVILLPLLIPTIVVLFSEPDLGLNYKGTVVVIVPEHSPFTGAESLFKTLRRVEKVVDALKSLRGFATFFLGLDTLIGTVPDQPRFRFRAADRIRYLKNITVRKGRYILGITIKRKKTFNNTTESILVFGLPGLKVHFYNDKAYHTTTTSPPSSLGSYVVKLGIGQFFVALRNMDTYRDQPPMTFPPGAIDSFEPSSHTKRWRNSLSSLKFDDDWLITVKNTRLPKGLPDLTCPKPHEPSWDPNQGDILRDVVDLSPGEHTTIANR